MCYWKTTAPGRAIFIAVVQFMTAVASLVWIFAGNPDTVIGQLVITIIISTIVNLLIPFVLVAAVVNQEKAKRILWLRVWLSWEVAYLLYLLVSLVYVSLFQFEYGDGEGMRFFGLDGITFFLHCLFLYTIFTFYEKTMLKKEELPTRIVIHTEI